MKWIRRWWANILTDFYADAARERRSKAGHNRKPLLCEEISRDLAPHMRRMWMEDLKQQLAQEGDGP